MESIWLILVAAITVEALIEYVKLFVVEKQINWKQIGALVVGIVMAVLTNADLFGAVGVTFIVPYAGVILTGVIISRGANYAADFVKLISNAGKKEETE